MVIYLPGQSVDEEPLLDELTPREIVRELDKHVVGQADAKRAVAIALRNRIRRQKLPPEMAEEVMPKNILMIGPTGVGKTELARRLARLANSPFLKVEASKFTEVGYVGRDVESMIRDLVDISIDMVREERLDEVADRAELNAEDRLLDLLMPTTPEPSESAERTREKLRERLREGKLDERLVELEVKDRNPTFEITTNAGIEEMGINLKDVLPNLFGQKSRRRKMRVAEALDYLVQEEELKSLSVEDFIRILKEPKNALAKQYTALLETEGIKLILTDDALEEVAKFAAQVNESSENIGARRLHTIMEKLLEEVSFEGPDLKKKTLRVDAVYVRRQLADIVKDQDLSKYIL